MPGWLPTGRGIPIPPARLVDNKPQGLWWTTSYGSGTRATTFVFLPNGIHASNPRYGGGNLVDIEGQKKQPGANGVGPFTISGNTITREYDGNRSTDPYSTTADAWSPLFKIGAAVFRPVTAPTRQTLIASWTVAGTRYVFHPNDTYEMGQAASGGGWAAGARTAGSFSIDGHLVVLRSRSVPITITPIGFIGPDLILINGSALSAFVGREALSLPNRLALGSRHSPRRRAFALMLGNERSLRRRRVLISSSRARSSHLFTTVKQPNAKKPTLCRSLTWVGRGRARLFSAPSNARGWRAEQALNLGSVRQSARHAVSPVFTFNGGRTARDRSTP